MNNNQQRDDSSSSNGGEEYSFYRHQDIVNIPQSQLSLVTSTQLPGPFHTHSHTHTLTTPSPSPPGSVPPFTPWPVGGYSEQQGHVQAPSKHPDMQRLFPVSDGRNAVSPATISGPPQDLYPITERPNRDVTISEPYHHLPPSDASDRFAAWPMMHGGYSGEYGPGNTVNHLPGGQGYLPSNPQTLIGSGTVLPTERPSGFPPDLTRRTPVATPRVIEAANKRRKTAPKFICQQCGQTFTAPHGLTNHEKVHLGIRDFVCEHCQKAFTTKHTCRRHAATCRSKFY